MKGWIKIKDDKYGITYKHSRIYAHFVWIINDHRNYEVFIPASARRKGKRKKFETKAEALKYAKNWMKKHPRG